MGRELCLELPSSNQEISVSTYRGNLQKQLLVVSISKFSQSGSSPKHGSRADFYFLFCLLFTDEGKTSILIPDVDTVAHPVLPHLQETTMMRRNTFQWFGLFLSDWINFALSKNGAFNSVKRAFLHFLAWFLKLKYLPYYFVSYQRTFLAAIHHSMPVLCLKFLNRPAHWYTDSHLQDAGKIGCIWRHMLQSWFLRIKIPKDTFC